MIRFAHATRPPGSLFACPAMSVMLIIGVPTPLTVAAQENDLPPNAAIEEVVVTGIRGSIQRAQDIKRNSDAVVEAITIEDLGKFSDKSIADSLSRVPGVQIERNDDGRDGARIAIRGLGSQFVTTTLNGRTVFSGGAEGTRQLRSFSFDAQPSEIFTEIIARKTPTADHVEAGIAGQVDVCSMRPLSAAAVRDS